MVTWRILGRNRMVSKIQVPVGRQRFSLLLPKGLQLCGPARERLGRAWPPATERRIPQPRLLWPSVPNPTQTQHSVHLCLELARPENAPSRVLALRRHVPPAGGGPGAPAAPCAAANGSPRPADVDRWNNPLASHITWLPKPGLRGGVIGHPIAPATNQIIYPAHRGFLLVIAPEVILTTTNRTRERAAVWIGAGAAGRGVQSGRRPAAGTVFRYGVWSHDAGGAAAQQRPFHGIHDPHHGTGGLWNRGGCGFRAPSWGGWGSGDWEQPCRLCWAAHPCALAGEGWREPGSGIQPQNGHLALPVLDARLSHKCELTSQCP